MQFHVDQDAGEAIAGWIAPDDPGSVPTLIVSIPNSDDIVIRADRPRPDIRDIGLHNTGMVGFFIDDSQIPGLSAIADLSMREAETGVLIHRRFPGFPRKLMMFDASMTARASQAMKADIGGRFTLAYDAIERHPFDTLFGIVNNQFADSIYISGRPSFLRYQNFLQSNGFIRAALLRHPFETLALRLEIAQQAALDADATPYSADLEPLVDLMRTTNLGSALSLQTAMQSLTDAQKAAIANPVVRTLACVGDEPPARHHVAVALDNLAAMDLVGVYSRIDDFWASLSEIVGDRIVHNPAHSPIARQASAALARIDPLRRLLALDLSLHSYVEDALKAADAEFLERRPPSNRSVS